MADFKARKPKLTNTVPGITYMLAGATQRGDSDPYDQTSKPVTIGPRRMIKRPNRDGYERRLQMPLAKIYLLEGQYNDETIGRVSTAIQNALVSTLGIPPDDFFQIIHTIPRSQFLHTPSFLGLDYSDDLIMLELTVLSRRPQEKRLELLQTLNDNLVSDAGISPDDLYVILYEVPGENVSFGRGLAQRVQLPDRDAEDVRSR